jgi:5'-nucleotidase
MDKMSKNAQQKKVILVTNDDGITALGLKVLADHLSAVGEVYVVAPDRESSAAGHSLTLHHPLRMTEVGPRMAAVEGTPTDCVLLAYHRVLPEKPAIVFSGINYGHNLGDDVTYSGTVSAAFEATLLGLPSVAISIGREGKKIHYEVAAKFAVKLARKILQKGLPKDTLLNVNVPNVPESRLKGVVITRQGQRAYGDVIVERVDPRGRPYFWIGNGEPLWRDDRGADINAIRADKISITPIHLDLTNHKAIEKLKGWKLRV